MPKDTASTRPRRRSRGEGAIAKIGEGRFRGAIWLEGPDGQPHRKWVRGRSQAAIVRKFDELRKTAAEGLPDGKTTGDYLRAWVQTLEGRNLRPSTVREYARHVETYWIPEIGKIELVKLTPSHVETALGKLKAQGLSATTRRSARTTLRAALAKAMRDEKIRRNVAALVEQPEADRPEMRALTAEEVGTLLEATADDQYGPLFALAVSTGLKLGEIVALRWTDIDMQSRSLVVQQAAFRLDDGTYDFGKTKTKRSNRTVMLPAVAMDALRRQKARQAEARLAVGTAWQDRRSLVFTDAVGRHVNPGSVSKSFRAAADKLGLEDVRLHDLRHTYATLALRNGVPLKVVSEALGHVSITVTADVYAHVSPDQRREVADAMDRALGGAS